MSWACGGSCWRCVCYWRGIRRRLPMKIILATVAQVALVATAAGQTLERTSVLGHVYAGGNGVPSIGAKISLQDESFGIHRRAGQIATDENGSFRFDNLSGGFYMLSIEQPGFLPEYVSVEPGRAIDIRLKRSAGISGRVLDADGQGISKAVVEIGVLSYAYGEVSLQPVSKGFAYTDDRGNWRLPDLASGQYYLRTSCNGLIRCFIRMRPAWTGRVGLTYEKAAK